MRGVRLLKTNLFTFKREIPLEGLPLTFQHTVILARKLLVRYIWIDSLCIIQDSLDDWQRESSKMTEVYSNSWLNIAASDSSSGDGGLFRQRSPLTINPCRITAKWNEGHPHVFNISRKHNHLADIIRSSLNTRAWVLQERLLAKRTVHFCRRQIYWECGCSLVPEAEPGIIRSPSDIKRWIAGADDTSVEPDTLAVKSLKIWSRILIDYSRTKLSVESDKLVAISGLARRISGLSNGTLGNYIAGLWEAKLVSQLCWITGDHSHRPCQYRAPSWSWASVEGYYSQGLPVIPQDHYNHDWKLMAEVQSSRVDYAYDRYGSVTGGSLIMKCSLFGMAVATITVGEYFADPDPAYDGPSQRCVRIGTEHPSKTNYIDKLITWLDDLTEENLIDLDLVPLYGLPLQASTWGPRETNIAINYGDIMDCLVLRPTATRGQYQRVGLLRWQVSRRAGPLEHGVEEASAAKACIDRACATSSLDTSMYLDLREGNSYIIEII